MSKLELLMKMNNWLLNDMPRYKSQALQFPKEEQAQWQLFRSLVNVREPRAVDSDFIEMQNRFLQEEVLEKGITDVAELEALQDRIYLWQGDITTLRVDAIVNAANSGMTGCYCPCHGCIDNAIHTFAGVQLRQECDAMMRKQGFPEPTGQAKITKAYNLPCAYVIHTVGPIVRGRLSERDCALLKSCYQSCLEAAEQKGLKTLAFCCISTGEFHFPNQEAAEIAVKTVRAFLSTHKELSVVFNVFKDVDYEIYRKLLR